MNKTEFEYLGEIKDKRKTYFLVKKNEKKGLLTAEHDIQIPVEWDELEINNRFSLMDYLHIPNCFSIFDKNESVVVIFVKRKHKWGVLNLYGDVIIPVIYDRIEIVSFAGKFYFKVVANEKEGLICLNENILIPVKWEMILPASFSRQESDPQFLWVRQADCLFCFESYEVLENPTNPNVQHDKGHYQFVIYNRHFELVTPEVLDGYAIFKEGYRLAKPFSNLAYILIRKQEQYGVLSHDIRLISKPVLTEEEAIALIRKQQQKDYIKILIDDIKDDCKKINKYLKQNKIATKNEISPTQKMTGDGLISENTMVTKTEIKKIAAVLVDQLTDLKAFKLAEGARKMEALIEKEDHQAYLAIIGDLLEWLQSLKVNPELTIENRPVIEKENDQGLQPIYNQGFAEAISNSESEFQKEPTKP